MTTFHRELMKSARNSLEGKWGYAAGLTLVYFLVTVIVGAPKYMQIAAFVVNGPLAVGYSIVMLSISRRQEVRYSMLFQGFKQFLTSFVAFLLMVIFILLKLLLLIVPGILAALSYSMTYFIIIDNPGIRASDALRKSKNLMYGHRWDYSCLLFRFTGWLLLGILTCGIGFLWIGPYLMTTTAHYYQTLLENTGNPSRLPG